MKDEAAASILFTRNSSIHFSALFKLNTFFNAVLTSNMQEKLTGSFCLLHASLPMTLTRNYSYIHPRVFRVKRGEVSLTAVGVFQQ
jgi:hypothetical protein